MLKPSQFLQSTLLISSVITGVSIAQPSALASDSPNTYVVSSAYLKSSPHLGTNNLIELEPTGTPLTVLAGGNSWWAHVQTPNGTLGYITTNARYVHLGQAQQTQPVTNTPQLPVSTVQTVPSPVFLPTSSIPGVTIDLTITPLAGESASYQQKVDAIKQVADSKLGLPYRWGNNQDRGDASFDCSNFVAYVYHHALGYKITTFSRKQYSSTGISMPFDQMRAGDLLAFDQGGHTGIYLGNGQMIQMGGGTAKVSYLTVAPGSYWYKHLSAVNRLF